MAIEIRSPKYSFVRFNDSTDDDTCWGDGVVKFCLPVYLSTDIAFQFVAVCDTNEEADLLSGADDLMEIGLVTDCEDNLALTFQDAPDRYRISNTEVLYNWTHGLTGFDNVYQVNDCFRIKVIITIGYTEITACSNCFERIGADCYTSVIDYGADENQFDFNYCGSGSMFEDGGEGEVCVEPTIIPFSNVATLNITYTTTLRDKYGDVPTVEVWILDGGVYVRPEIRAGFDAYPPTAIIADLGGSASGFVKIS